MIRLNRKQFERVEQEHLEYQQRYGMDPLDDFLEDQDREDRKRDRRFEMGDQARLAAYDERRVRNILRPRTGEVQVQPQSKAA